MTVKISDRLEKVKGMNDVLPAEYAGGEAVLAGLKGSFKAFGYHLLDVPVVEHTDLYLRKAGEDIIARLYDFTFQSRRLCLRPEMTASIIRAYIENLQASALPVRLSYAGPVFRYEKPQRGRQRQFTQAGVELIGAGGPLADAEVIALACRGLDGLNLAGYQVVIGHVGILSRFLAGLQLDSRLRDFLLTNIELLRSRGPQAVRERLPSIFPSLTGAGSGAPAAAPGEGLESLLAGLDEPAARSMVLDLLKSMEFELLGSSRPEDEIVTRLLTKIRRRNQAPRLEQALEFLHQLCQLTGPPAAVFEQAGALLTGYNLGLEPLHELRAVIDTLAAYDLDMTKVTIDLGLSRGLQYYTGMIFEIYHGSPGEERQLAGGGRYDDLVATLGGRKSVPGCGFSYGLERILLALQDEGLLQLSAPAADLLVAAVSPAESAQAIRAAEALRKAGLAVEVDVRGRSVTSNLQYANGRGIPFAAIVGSEELASGLLRLKTMASGQEQRLSTADVVRTVRQSGAKGESNER